jgi:hypothetical protein
VVFIVKVIVIVVEMAEVEGSSRSSGTSKKTRNIF